MDEVTLEQQAAGSFDLADGETVEFACRPAKVPRVALYIGTLGLYEFWRRANFYVVTDRRVAERAGRVTGTEASLPLFYVQDATIRTFLWWGYVFVSTAGGEGGGLSTRWIGKADARRLRRAAWNGATGPRPALGDSVKTWRSFQRRGHCRWPITLLLRNRLPTGSVAFGTCSKRYIRGPPLNRGIGNTAAKTDRGIPSPLWSKAKDIVDIAL